MHRGTSALAALALIVGLAGCGTDGGEDEATSSPQEPTSIDAALLECGEVTAEDPTLQLPDIDLTAATWDMPEGFVETFEYSEDLPVEHIESFWVAEPAKDPTPLNVLTVVVYSQLDWGEKIDECGRVPRTAVDSRLEGYNEHNGAEPLTKVREAEVGGLPALEQQVLLPEYSYEGLWLFSRDQLLHVYCQWTSEEEKAQVLEACDDLVASVVVPGA
jgi:hypothetical protein